MKNIKKFIYFFVVFIFVGIFSLVYAASLQRINFDGKIFELKYSVKSSITHTYFNEYYRIKGTYDNWDELIGVYYFPQQTSYINYAKKFNNQILALGRKPILLINEKEGFAIIAFLSGGGKIPTKAEYNTFKCQKSPKGGTIAMQYARRYFINNDEDKDAMIADIKKNRARWINNVAKMPMLGIIEKDIDTGKS